ncbi:MAG: hypothetical protein FD173_2255 [Gallionellaceae bacterium]|nr:MAG: hypothetical protein FD173_2255 [Gallionellaceae bacterium]
MIALHKKRFSELCEQLDVVEKTKQTESSQRNSSSTYVDNNLLLNWKVKAKNLLQAACGVDS